MDAEAYSLAIDNRNSPTTFVARILSSLFTYQELMNSNLTGVAATRRGSPPRMMNRLDPDRIDAIIRKFIIPCLESFIILNL